MHGHWYNSYLAIYIYIYHSLRLTAQACNGPIGPSMPGLGYVTVSSIIIQVDPVSELYSGSHVASYEVTVALQCSLCCFYWPIKLALSFPCLV